MRLHVWCLYHVSQVTTTNITSWTSSNSYAINKCCSCNAHLILLVCLFYMQLDMLSHWVVDFASANLELHTQLSNWCCIWNCELFTGTISCFARLTGSILEKTHVGMFARFVCFQNAAPGIGCSCRLLCVSMHIWHRCAWTPHESTWSTD